MNEKINFSKSTAYIKMLEDSNQTIGVSHHPNGLGKLKVVDNGTEYGVPIIDVINKPLSAWRIDKK